jgi:hypothetical protein
MTRDLSAAAALADIFGGGDNDPASSSSSCDSCDSFVDEYYYESQEELSPATFDQNGTTVVMANYRLDHDDDMIVVDYAPLAPTPTPGAVAYAAAYTIVYERPLPSFKQIQFPAAAVAVRLATGTSFDPILL